MERPKNPVVVAYSKNKDKYAVRSRKGCRYESGRRIPVEGSIVGHIVNGEYVTIEIEGPFPLTRSPSRTTATSPSATIS